MDKELEAIKTAIENYRHNTETRHKENAQKAAGIARQMLDWFYEQYKPYKEVIGASYVNILLDDTYTICFGEYASITELGCHITRDKSTLTNYELDVVKKFVKNWQTIKNEVRTTLATKNKFCLDEEQSLCNTELETQELFDSFEV